MKLQKSTRAEPDPPTKKKKFKMSSLLFNEGMFSTAQHQARFLPFSLLKHKTDITISNLCDFFNLKDEEERIKFAIKLKS